LPEVKFGGPRGGVACLFQLGLIGHYPVLVLTEGEWDAMLLWEYCPDLCDVGTLGGAAAKLDLLDLSSLTRYLAVLVIHDDDKAGEEGRQYFSELHTRFPRMQSIQPPAHDLTDFWKAGGDLRSWLAGKVSDTLENALKRMTGNSPRLEDWKRISRLAKAETL
jgi:5S rRNA maturation endonuclease (ribonuclease M5)